MGTSFLQGHGTRQTPQRERIPGRADQVQNSEGGYVFEVPALERLRRFLILGSEGGSYYAGERELTKENLEGVRDALNELGPAAVAEIVAISRAGRAPKQDPAIYALAMAASHPSNEVRRAALDAIPSVCRTATALFHFCAYVEQYRGWGRALRRAVARWYGQPAEQVAYQAVKYRQRDGYTHRDVLRLTHGIGLPLSLEHRIAFDWICGRQPNEEGRAVLDAGGGVGPNGAMLPADDPLRIIEGYERVKRATTEAAVSKLVESYALPREAIPTEWLTKPGVWDALLHAGSGMPITALVRNLATMTRIGLLAPGSDATRKVREMVTSEDRLQGGRVHPISLLLAHRTYSSGKSIKGTAAWAPVGEVVDALDEAFYLAFGTLPETGLRYLLGVDVSGSMDGSGPHGYGGFPNCTGAPELTPREAAMAMAMVQAHSGDSFELTAFSAPGRAGGHPAYAGRDQGHEVLPGLSVLPFTARQRLDDILDRTRHIYPGGTDASLPMEYAIKMGRKVDVFVLYTDSETWAGRKHPLQALADYRAASGIEAKLVCVNFVANRVSIADPKDPGTLDVVGFDAAVPQLMADFAAGWGDVA